MPGRESSPLEGGFASTSIGTPVEEVLLGLGRALRAAGVMVDASRSRDFVAAAGLVGVGNRDGVYWAGRSCLCGGPEDFAIYDAVFEAWFAQLVPGNQELEDGGGPDANKDGSGGADAGLPSSDETAQSVGADAVVAMQASRLERLRRRDLAELSAAEIEDLETLFATLRPVPPQHRSNRRSPSRRGELDGRSLMRDQVRLLGEPAAARYRRRATRPRRTVLLIDVSGSMAPYSEALLRLAHVWVRSQPGLTEAFTIGTRLTRVSAALADPDPARALRAAGKAVPDWSGGTRLGDVLAAYLDRWGQSRITRGAAVVIFSDGWERGPAEPLGEQMARLRRSAHRVIWANPHRGRAGFRPVQSGMLAALPHCDAFVPGHSIEAFAEVITQVAAS